MSFDSFISSQLYTRKSQNLIKLGFDFNNDPESEYYKIQKLLFQEYFINNGSMLTIMKQFDIPSTRTLDIMFRLFDIDARSFSDANKNASQSGRSQLPHSFKFNYGWHTTFNNKQVFLRSSYERAFAIELDNAQIDYDTECLRIVYFDASQKTHRIAIPDFYIPSTNTIVEIKAKYWLDHENMKCKVLEYKRLGFNFRLIVDFEEVELEL